MQLVPCPGCNRHVDVSETVCPFCREELELQAFALVEMPRDRVSRGTWFSFNSSSRRAAGVLVAASAATTAGACAVYGDPGPYQPSSYTDVGVDDTSNVDGRSGAGGLDLHLPSDDAGSSVDAPSSVDVPSDAENLDLHQSPPEDTEPTTDSSTDTGD